MKMTIKEFIELWADGTQDDIDVYDNVCEELGIAYCGGIELTKAGEEHFKDVLDYEIEIETNPRYSVAIVDVDKHDWKSRLRKAKEFFYSAAGYCSDSNYNKWFREVKSTKLGVNMNKEPIYEWMDYAAEKLKERILPDIDIDDWMWDNKSFQFVFIINASSRTNAYVTDPYRFCYDAEEDEKYGRNAYQQLDDWIEDRLYRYLK